MRQIEIRYCLNVNPKGEYKVKLQCGLTLYWNYRTQSWNLIYLEAE